MGLVTVQDALAAWNAGEPIQVFEVESEGTPQIKLWSEAFDLIAVQLDVANPPVFGDGLTDREKDVVLSIVHVAQKVGWFKMIRQHTDGCHALTIQQKPKEVSA